MKTATLLFSVLFFPFLGNAAQIDLATAQSIGEHFLQRNSPATGDSASIQLELALRMTSAGIDPTDLTGVSTYYYVFNRDPGFIIVAGDDAVTPILGYSDDDNYALTTQPVNLAKWMEGYKQAIVAAIAVNASAPADIHARWIALAHPGSALGQVSDRGVSPLLQTQWNQSPYYNALCPGGSVTGCVATATAQVMKFWNYPATGTGFHSYNSASYGTLSFNYANTTFDWTSMPNSINSSNTAIATLMSAAGVGVNMNYSPQESTAYMISSSSPIQNCAEYALKTYFGYDQNLHGVARANYSDLNWTNLMKGELDNGRPILYDGSGTNGGHCFVFDGYNDSNMFHVNWGWAGNSDGYFAVDGLNPGSLGTGGGAGGFNSGQEAVIGIQPPSNTQTYDMQLYDYVTADPSVIAYGQSFSVSTNILNNASTAFAGDYCAAAFDSQGNFVDYVQTYLAQNLPAGFVYNSDIVFSNSGDFALLPGSYTIGIYYRPTGGNWQQVADGNGYTNFVPLTVVNSNVIEMYTEMNVTSGEPLVVGTPVDVQLEFANYGTSTITANYDLSLYNLDGSFAQTIQEVNNISLQSGYYYGPLDFSNASVTAPPGSYLMALEYTTDGGTTWQLVGSTTHGNPVIVTVQTAPLPPDIYEPNDSYASSYVFTPNFSNDQAVVNTVGSNCHVGTDNDYYAVNLPT
ncbi:MAG: C10 family peptidase, partial [Flavobacteriales bacterium]